MSIKVDGKGSATITDMMVELEPNRDRYEDVYPSDSDYESENEDDSDFDNDNKDIKKLQEEDEIISQALKKAVEDKLSSSGRLSILEKYGTSVGESHPEDIDRCLENYARERKKAFEIYNASEIEIAKLNKKQEKLSLKLEKAQYKAYKEELKANKEKQKEKDKKQREKEVKLQAKRQLKADRVRFWAKKVYKVVVSLDAMSEMTPASSRRGSVSSVGKVGVSSTASDACQIALSISYITNWASWAPRYDLSLSTPTNSGTIIYRAELCNSTSETWKDAKVILSTSQTAFQGLGEPIPIMQPWHIRLAKGSLGNQAGALYSNHEQQFKQSNLPGSNKNVQQPRETLFGLDGMDGQWPSSLAQPQLGHQKQIAMQQNQVQRAVNLFGNSTNANQVRPFAFGHTQAQSDTHFGGLAGSSIPFGASASQPSEERSRSSREMRTEVPYATGHEEDASAPEHAEEVTIIPDLPALTTQDSTWAESGWTATYEIPGLRTINPSHTMRRHKIASIHLKDTHLSHLLVPKLRAAAFLKARLRNTSSINLLRGPAGLTLDGSFLGNTTLPRCSANETFSLSLGVDPSVSVTYAKPTVRRSQSGIINKEGSGVYTRSCTITNTKPNRAIEGLVLDQVPVSEDERLKVEILQPRGLRHEGDTVKTGLGITTAGKEEPKWGKASAIVKKAGEVCWDFKIEARKGARFSLEYEARFPSGEMVLGI